MADRKKIGGLGVYEVVAGVFQKIISFAPLKGDKPGHVEKQRTGILFMERDVDRSGPRTGRL